MNKENLSLGRRFLGVFPPITTFDKKHLKSYLKGYVIFTYGFDKEWKTPITHTVKQEYYNKEENSGESK